MDISREEFYICSEPAPLRLHTAIIAPKDCQPSACLQIVHGMSEHKERYYPFMEYLAEKSFACIINDVRGHGKSVISPDDLGDMYDLPDERAVSDIYRINSYIREKYPDIPHFLFAHSMGSLSARCFLQNGNELVDGVILSGCPCYSKFSSFVRMVESGLESTLGHDFRSKGICSLSDSFLNVKFRESPHSWICSDPMVVMRFKNDPLCNFDYALSGYEALLKLMKRTYSEEEWKKGHIKNKELPIHFISGKDDPCMFSENKFFEAVRFLEHQGFPNVSHKLYKDMRHEVLNERNKAVVWHDTAEKLISWKNNGKDKNYGN